MEGRKYRRSVQISFKQKKKLLECMTKHPELISCKVTQDFTYQDAQRLWRSIADECNKLPGATKTWKQWKKTWHDLRSNTKKREKADGSLPTNFISVLSAAEKEALGLNPAAISNNQETTVFVPLDSENTEDNYTEQEYIMDTTQSLSEPESPPETKLFVKHRTKIKNNLNSNLHSSNSCSLNCDLIAVHEKKKLLLKEDYINFKKDYLRQKLKLIKEQTEALKTIAKELSEK